MEVPVLEANDPSSIKLYRPLETQGHIRLLDVRRGALSFSLFTTTIVSVQNQYYALSYTWGDPTDEFHITINDRIFPIRGNVFHFLEQLRSKQWTGLLWIDAICINQSDIFERNQQVQNMKAIYAEARGVLAWLGPGSEHISRLVEQSYDEEGFDEHGQVADFPFTKPDLQGVLEIVRCTYWSRIWTVQELAVAKKVTLMAGEAYIGIDIFRRLVGHTQKAEELFLDLDFASWLISDTRNSSRWTLHDLAQWRDISYFYWHHIIDSEKNNSQSLHDLLFSFGTKECQDKHDRVYALLGLENWPVSDTSIQHLSVDYHDSLPELFVKTLSYLQKAGTVEMLDVLDLVHLLELGKEADEKVRSTLITLHQPLIGTVGQNVKKMILPGLKLAHWKALESLDTYEIWAHTKDLRRCAVENTKATDVGWPGTIICDSDAVLPGQRLFSLSVDLASTRNRFRPASCDSLVLVSHGDHKEQRSISIGVYIYSFGGIIHRLEDAGDYGQQLLLVRWRHFFDEHLRKARFDIVDDGNELSITLPLAVYISLSEAILESTEGWDLSTPP